jgi:hypothetical protein
VLHPLDLDRGDGGPGIRESRVRRIVLPRVYPNPGSSGSTMIRERTSAMLLLRFGDAERSTRVTSLRVELDDQLLVDGGVDLVPTGMIQNDHRRWSALT